MAERLVQRLISGIGHIDSRFSSKYLIRVDNNRCLFGKRRSIEYLIRIDELSCPQLYSGDKRPRCEVVESENDSEIPGFARMYLKDATVKRWTEFVNSSGYLRR